MSSLPIFFGSGKCPACVGQKKILQSKVVNVDYYYYDLEKLPVPRLIIDKSGSYSMPTWWIPIKIVNGVPYGKLLKGMLSIQQINKFMKKKSNRPRNLRFGASEPVKSFPNGQGFMTSPTWEEVMRQQYGGDGTNSVPFGGQLKNTDIIFDKAYYLAPGGTIPNGDLGTYLGLNRTCNGLNKNRGFIPGLLSGSPYQEIN